MRARFCLLVAADVLPQAPVVVSDVQLGEDLGHGHPLSQKHGRGLRGLRYLRSRCVALGVLPVRGLRLPERLRMGAVRRLCRPSKAQQGGSHQMRGFHVVPFMKWHKNPVMLRRNKKKSSCKRKLKQCVR